MLTARERELIEEHLVNDVASHLQEVISDAEAEVEEMNVELSERPTSTGMRLRLRWEPSPDGPPGLVEARRRLLRQDAELWSPADRAAVGEFLQGQIEAGRARAEDSTWQEDLGLAPGHASGNGASTRACQASPRPNWCAATESTQCTSPHGNGTARHTTRWIASSAIVRRPHNPAARRARITPMQRPSGDRHHMPLDDDSPNPLGTPAMGDEDRLKRVLGPPQLSWLVARVRTLNARAAPLD